MQESPKDARESQFDDLPNLSKFDPQEVLINMIGEHPSPKARRRACKTLAEIVGRSDPFSIAYIENIHSGRWKPGASGKLYAALRAVWEHQQGGHPILGAYSPRSVWVIPDNVPPNAIILGKARNCRYCGIPFVGVIHNQEYCCKQHRIAFYKESR